MARKPRILLTNDDGIMPLHCDMTEYGMMEELKGWAD